MQDLCLSLLSVLQYRRSFASHGIRSLSYIYAWSTEHGVQSTWIKRYGSRWCCSCTWLYFVVVRSTEYRVQNYSYPYREPQCSVVCIASQPHVWCQHSHSIASCQTGKWLTNLSGQKKVRRHTSSPMALTKSYLTPKIDCRYLDPMTRKWTRFCRSNKLSWDRAAGRRVCSRIASAGDLIHAACGWSWLVDITIQILLRTHGIFCIGPVLYTLPGMEWSKWSTSRMIEWPNAPALNGRPWFRGSPFSPFLLLSSQSTPYSVCIHITRH